MFWTSILLVVVVAGLIGFTTWSIGHERLSRLGAFLCMSMFSALLTVLSLSLAETLVKSGSGIPLLLCNLMIIPAAYSSFGFALPLFLGVAIQAFAMGGIGFYIWSGLKRRKTMRTTG